MSQIELLQRLVDEGLDQQIEELTELVAIPSVGADPEHAADLEASAQFVRDAFAALGLDARVTRSEIAPGQPGAPAVLASTQREEGKPTVLLYAHHDVQPLGIWERWKSHPFKVDLRGGRLFGRGTSDDGGGIAVHLGAIRALQALGEPLPTNLVVFVEGEEEVGSPSFRNFLLDHKEELEADTIIVADSTNWTVDVPSVTASLRGVVTLDVNLRVLDQSVHSGMFGGPVLDAVTLAARLINTLHDEDGNVAVPGLGGRESAEVEWDEEDYRTQAHVVDGYQLAGTADLAARVWTMPAISITGIDAPSVEDSINSIIPDCRFRLSVRTAPGTDSQAVADAVVSHLQKYAPFGCELTTDVVETAPSYQTDLEQPALRDLRWALEQAWQTPAVAIGVGGSIPFIAEFEEAFPNAQILITGIEDPQTSAHSENESQSLKVLRNATLAEALLLQSLGKEKPSEN